ncbi:DUF2460 domain-containing protein [Aurantiacibacter spongiae]|uniref:TIGR02217 family protein n=1 Tax=Aurantiacibacter spongiae TaxID=2488860 RepID=A0A3N5DKG6_9SPHN|nr:DUF2460 domain-containing protein [Aurantiacibacter spongiae]RPF71265.1 TIGR02217 family protein [Aurantiacibacter spongiae]
MAYWLASDPAGHETDTIQRFDPRFWTIDFPRPEMATVFTLAPDALRVTCDFQHRDALVGLIWESEDRYDHPLLAYESDRDYGYTTLSFDWQSSAGILPLDRVHGPTLTIEGRDAAGVPRSWYVRLWNYAAGTAVEARITLPFDDLRDGWDGTGERVHPHDIDRMFISLVPPGYDPADHALLAEHGIGQITLRNIRCDGDRSMLGVGDVMVPPHGTGMATAYDDSYNLTPERVVRNIMQLGYRGRVVHYVGMSHYFQLVHAAGGALLVDPAGTICAPCRQWHMAYFASCKAVGLQPVASLSYELFDAHCPGDWKQRAFDGSPALTGWEPPSTLLSPASDAAMRWLQDVAAGFCALFRLRDVPVEFQIGEPWWWIAPGAGICLYDSGIRAIRSDTPEIADLIAPLEVAQRDFLDWAGDMLGRSVIALRDRVLTETGGGAVTHLLLFTPTLLDPERPDLRRALLSDRWRYPAFDRLQLEDYDWLTGGAEALRRNGYAAMDAALGYPVESQDYLAGFVLRPADAERFWRLIDAGLDEATARGVGRTFVWALPQVARDGYVRLPLSPENLVNPFDDVLYPLALGRDAGVSPEFSTSIALTASGHERRNSQWSDARLHYDVGPGIRSHAELGILLEFYRARRGPARGFRLEDPFDFSSSGLTGTPTATDQLIGTSDGLTATFRLVKSYGGGSEPQQRIITRPRAGTIIVSVDGTTSSAWTLEEGGRIVFRDAPPAGAAIRAGFLFDVPVRFAEDRLDITGATFAAGEAPSVPLIELREAV